MAAGGTPAPGRFGVGPVRAGRIGKTIGGAAGRAFHVGHPRAAAATKAPPAAAAPGAATSGEATPFDALYWANQAAIQHSYEHAQALYGTGANGEPLGSARTEARAGETRNLQTLARQEPETLRASRNKANSEGLLESGIEGARRGTVESQYAAKRGSEALKLQSSEDRFTNTLEGAREARERGEISDAEKAVGRGEASTLRAEPQTPPAAPGGPPTRVLSSRPQRPTGGVRRAAIHRAARRR